MATDLLSLGAGLYALGIIGLAVFVMGNVRPRERPFLMTCSLFVNLAGGLFFVNAMQ